MKITTYVFDIDETLLSISPLQEYITNLKQDLARSEQNSAKFIQIQNRLKLVTIQGRLHPNFFNHDTEKYNEEFLTTSSYNPYGSDFTSVCVTIHKTIMQRIMHNIIKNGDNIAFITAGSLTKDEIFGFVKAEYELTLAKNFMHYNFQNRKNKDLIKISKQHNSDLVFIDNSQQHIKHASKLKLNKHNITAIYANNNYADDAIPLTQWIDELSSDIEKRKQAKLDYYIGELTKYNQELEKYVSNMATTNSKHSAITNITQQINAIVECEDRSSLSTQQLQLSKTNIDTIKQHRNHRVVQIVASIACCLTGIGMIIGALQLAYTKGNNFLFFSNRCNSRLLTKKIEHVNNNIGKVNTRFAAA